MVSSCPESRSWAAVRSEETRSCSPWDTPPPQAATTAVARKKPATAATLDIMERPGVMTYQVSTIFPKLSRLIMALWASCTCSKGNTLWTTGTIPPVSTNFRTSFR